MKTRWLALAILAGAMPALTAHGQSVTAAAPSQHALNAAIAEYQVQLRTSPGDAALHNKLGVCYQKSGKLKQARKEYEKALSLNSLHAQAWNNLGTLEYGRRKYDKAVTNYKKALAIDPQQATFFRNLGTAWLAKGNLAAAVEAYGEAYRLSPASLAASDDPARFPSDGVAPGQLYFAYAKLFAANVDLESALYWLRKARDSGFRDFGRVASDPDFSAVVKDPRYTDLTR